MDALRRILSIALGTSLLCGCQATYLIKSAYNHLSLLSKREKIEKLISNQKSPLSEATQKKLKLALQVRQFAIDKIKLKETSNYTSYIDVGRPYVSWVISAAPQWELEHFEWSYPIVGKMPYKGFPSEQDAQSEVNGLQEQGYDIFSRGVSAYSTLGWFEDSVLSTMLPYSDADFANTIIHEMTHTTIYIKNNADYNERLAVFVGNQGTIEFYESIEGPNSETVRAILAEAEDDKIFSEFIGAELKDLKKWYQNLPKESRSEELRKSRLKEIQIRFKEKIQPKMKTESYKRFLSTDLNNAKLLYFKTYMEDLKSFEDIFTRCRGNWDEFFKEVQKGNEVAHSTR